MIITTIDSVSGSKSVWLLLNRYYLPTFHSEKDTNEQDLLFSLSVQSCSRDGVNVSSYSSQVDSGADALSTLVYLIFFSHP